jgi:dTDP-glucose 4,6-dehydratase
VENNPGYRFVHANICDADAVREAMQGVDTVVHFAAESHVDRSIMDPGTFLQTNVMGTFTLLEAARELGVAHFHHVSTDEVFGSLALGSADKFNEETAYDPRSPYSASKASSDHLVRAYGETYALPYTITNCSNNYGPYMFPEKLFSLAITNLLEGKKVPVYTPGNQVRDWLFVFDHCSAIEAVLQSGKKGETYCVGGMSRDIANIDAVRMIVELMGMDESMIEFVADRPGHDVRYAIDWSKINHEFGWKPSVTLEEGLRQMVEWYRTHEAWWKPLKGAGYLDYYRRQYEERQTR